MIKPNVKHHKPHRQREQMFSLQIQKLLGWKRKFLLQWRPKIWTYFLKNCFFFLKKPLHRLMTFPFCSDVPQRTSCGRPIRLSLEEPDPQRGRIQTGHVSHGQTGSPSFHFISPFRPALWAFTIFKLVPNVCTAKVSVVLKILINVSRGHERSADPPVVQIRQNLIYFKIPCPQKSDCVTHFIKILCVQFTFYLAAKTKK